MNIICKSSALAVCAGLFACGGSQKPAVEPASADSTAVQAPARLDTLITDQDRFSYALGKDLGRAIANVNVPLRMDLVKKAIDDQLDSTKKSLMSDSASEAALQDLLLRMQQQKEAEEKAAAKKNLDEQVQFLAKNILDSTVKTTPKGVQYKILLDGPGITPKASDKVQVHYVGALLNGKEFDNSVKRGEPMEFPVNAVIEGWQDLLMIMHEGMKVKAWIPSELAYGAEGVPPSIPPNSLLVFEVQLLKVYAENPEPLPAASAPADSAAAPAAAPADPAAKPATKN
ncbi:FKBP-type peptidyl-prolyl cis-trans isomerase [uncultured Fibrobacter sp.]|uniref:FKBP-type peptidyl-prolyl cis-trans isomerase n=1 Tax=uncultured Fibrobacter sp. TaxID=261512 RepID=UPI0025DA898D|nr:FKBP-type peptidyl-prolyl cis-trans isomerase [uncultured Fibrobacter sp.]